MKLCPPQTPLPTQPDEGAGWKYSANPFGSTVSKKSRQHHLGFGKWLLPSSLFMGMTSYQFQKKWLAYVANLYPRINPAQQTLYASQAAFGPVQNLKGVTKTLTTFQYWMYQATLSRWFWLYYRWNILHETQFPDINEFFPAYSVNTWPAPAIVDSSITNDMDISFTLASGPPSSQSRLVAYIAAPGVTTFKYSAMHSLWLMLPIPSPPVYKLAGSIVTQIIKKYPTDSDVLIGCRWSCLTDGVPSPLAVVSATMA